MQLLNELEKRQGLVQQPPVVQDDTTIIYANNETIEIMQEVLDEILYLQNLQETERGQLL